MQEKTENNEVTENTVILIVSFGTSCNDSRDAAIGAIEKAIENKFPEYEVRRAFTSRSILDKLKAHGGMEIDSVEEALDRAAADGIANLIVQPTFVVDGYESAGLARVLRNHTEKFDRIILGKPLLSDDADFEAVVKVITEKTVEYDDGETAICFVGHGTEADSNEVYLKLLRLLNSAGYENHYIGTIKAEPALDDVIAALRKKSSYKRVVLAPLMAAAGVHVRKEMYGDEDNSWKSVLQSDGYEVECIMEGLGQIPAIQELYAEHAKEAVIAIFSGSLSD